MGDLVKVDVASGRCIDVGRPVVIHDAEVLNRRRVLLVTTCNSRHQLHVRVLIAQNELLVFSHYAFVVSLTFNLA